MAKVTLLSHLATLTGTRDLEVDCATVGELLSVLGTRFGPDFARKLKSTKVLVNGVSVTSLRLGRTPLSATDTVSLLPPVAGG
jgi:sulfur-carrier protein